MCERRAGRVVWALLVHWCKTVRKLKFMRKRGNKLLLARRQGQTHRILHGWQVTCF